MAKITESLSSSIKSKFFGSKKTETSTSPSREEDDTEDTNFTSMLSVIAKNMVAFPSMARDLNVAGQNAAQLVSIMGEKPAAKGDMFLKNEDQKEQMLEQQRKAASGKLGAGKSKVVPVAPAKKESLLDKLKKQFAFDKILKSLKTFLIIAVVVDTIFSAFKDTFVEWAESLWEPIAEKFTEFIESFKTWFTESVQPILDKVMEFIKPLIDAAKFVFGKLADFFGAYFSVWAKVMETPIKYVKTLLDKAIDVFNGIIEKISSTFIGKKILDTLGIKKFEKDKPKQEGALRGQRTEVSAPEVKPQPVVESEDKKVSEKQSKEIEAERIQTEKVRQEQKEKMYDGNDEVIRKRLGLSEKTKTMKAEEGIPTPVTTAEPPPGPVPQPGPGTAPPSTEAKKELKVSSSDLKPTKLSASSGKAAMIAALDKNKITDKVMRAAIMAQTGHESGNFTTLSENLNYSEQGLKGTFPKYFKDVDPKEYAKQPVKIADRVYGGRMGNASEGSGEGFKYRGRGFVQLTGKQNYTKFGFGSNPEAVENVDTAADTAIKYMLNYKGDWGDITKVTKFVNGGTIGLADREKHFKEYLEDPKITQISAGAPATGAGAPATGAAISAQSTTVASGQREQQKPQTPNVINAATTNNTTVTVAKSDGPTPQNKDTAGRVTSRIS